MMESSLEHGKQAISKLKQTPMCVVWWAGKAKAIIYI